MKLTWLVLLIFFSSFSTAQVPENHGTFNKIRNKNVQAITKYQIAYNDTLPNDTTFIQQVTFDRKGQVIRRELPKYNGYMRRYIDYRYNSQGFVTSIDSSGLFGHGYGSIGPDTVYSNVEETWENYDTTSRIHKRRTSIDNWESYHETQFFYDSFGKLIEEKSIQVNKLLSEVYKFTTKYEYNSDQLLVNVDFYFEGRLHSRTNYLYKSF